MMNAESPPIQLLDEYGLNAVSHAALVTVRDHGPIGWDDPRLREGIPSLRPAPTLRKLVDRGLVIGPARNESIRARPFAITEAGRDVLARIERGLRTPRWLGRAKLAALRTLARRGPTPRPCLTRVEKVASASLDALLRAGYLTQDDDQVIHLTDLGREALTEAGRCPS